MKSKVVQDVNEWLSVSEAARQAGVNRRSIQRWVKAGSLSKGGVGKVKYADVLRQMAKRTRGRKPKGLPNGDEAPYWEVAGTPDWDRATEYFDGLGLLRLRRMLVTLSHHLHVKRNGDAFIEASRDALQMAEKNSGAFLEALKDALRVAEKTNHLQKENGYKDPSSQVQARRYLIKHPLKEVSAEGGSVTGAGKGCALSAKA